jgi:hypothetical protein
MATTRDGAGSAIVKGSSKIDRIRNAMTRSAVRLLTVMKTPHQMRSHSNPPTITLQAILTSAHALSRQWCHLRQKLTAKTAAIADG